MQQQSTYLFCWNNLRNLKCQILDIDFGPILLDMLQIQATQATQVWLIQKKFIH